MNLNWADIIYISIMLIGLGLNIAKHGETKKQKYDGISYFIAFCISVILLYFGGMFN